MAKLSADDFLRITAQFSVSINRVREITEDNRYLTALGLFTAHWCKQIFPRDLDFNEEIYVSEKRCYEAWHNAFVHAVQAVKVFELDKELAKEMFAEYIYGITTYLFADDDFSEYDFEDDVDETFYDPYTGSEEYE